MSYSRAHPRPSTMKMSSKPFKKQRPSSGMIEVSSGLKKLEELVPASGNIMAASLAHRLHNPSFTTTKVRNGSTADSSNPCTAIVMANGFDNKIIMVDHVVRGEVKDPPIYYPEDILACVYEYDDSSEISIPITFRYSYYTFSITLIYPHTKNLFQSHRQICCNIQQIRRIPKVCDAKLQSRSSYCTLNP